MPLKILFTEIIKEAETMSANSLSASLRSGLKAQVVAVACNSLRMSECRRQAEKIWVQGLLGGSGGRS